MNDIQILKGLPKSEQQGIMTVFQIPVKISVKEGSFLHIGGTRTPLREKQAPVFSVNGEPVIPASSFKGAFRYQLEQLLINKKNELKAELGIDNCDLIKPCIPAPNPSKGEKQLALFGYRERYCNISVEEEKVKVSDDHGICPVCYFFGSGGIMGMLRIPNFWSVTGEHIIDQTNIRIDRKSGTAAIHAKLEGEQVKPRTLFLGELEIVAKQGNFEFGRPREIGGKKIDMWLDGIAARPIGEAQLLLINKLLIPALNNITVLGGQKSKGAGKVTVEIDK